MTLNDKWSGEKAAVTTTENVSAVRGLLAFVDDIDLIGTSSNHDVIKSLAYLGTEVKSNNDISAEINQGIILPSWLGGHL